jgi:hypothetical protein
MLQKNLGIIQNLTHEFAHSRRSDIVRGPWCQQGPLRIISARIGAEAKGLAARSRGHQGKGREIGSVETSISTQETVALHQCTTTN